jgi:O-antigen chain-terminating methyltransferase
VNPASVFALVQIYYLDLSHEKPVHPRALQFMLESTGFSDVEVRYSAPLDAERLRELPGADERTSVMNENLDRLNDLLFAPPNYAVLGKKR